MSYCIFDSYWESPCELFLETLVFGVSRDQLAGRKTRDWLIGARQM